MRSYEEISKRIMERGDKLIESRRVRAAKIRHTSYAVSGMCAAAIAGIGVWHIASNIKKPDDGFNGSGIISATETVTEMTTTTTAKTTKAAATTAETTAIKKTTAVTTDKKTTETTSAKPVSTTAAGTSASVRTAIVTTENSPVSETSAVTAVTTTLTETPCGPVAPETTALAVDPNAVTTTTHAVNPPTGEDTGIVTSTASIEESIVTTKPNGTDGNNGWGGSDGNNGNGGSVTTAVTTTTSIQDAFRAYPTYITLNGVRYDKQAMVAEESIGSRISRVDVTIQYHRQFIRDAMSAYRIVNIDENEAVAVKLKDTDEYYLFRNPSYKKEE